MMATTHREGRHVRPRIVLLLDLDCFYAQCERIRLGLDQETCSLALLQWNSTLAVTYPARRLYQIKRGDSWEVVAQKSRNQCLAIHLPLLTSSSSEDDDDDDCKTTDDGTEASTTTTTIHPHTDVKKAYKEEYCLDVTQRQKIMQKEIGVQRFPYQGKACLERYRLASTCIFGQVVSTLEQILLPGNFVLERASIDELFLDVTAYCWGDNEDEALASNVNDSNETRITTAAVIQQTVVVGNGANNMQRHQDTNDPALVLALQRGCWVAHMIRKSIHDTLGFTLSAGISTNKLMAKLGASYGKPNGQAIIYPSAFEHVLATTPIRKVRNFGGKIGKQLVQLLAAGVEPTMGNVAKCLSLPQLVQELGTIEMAQRIFDSARGIDEEPVRETKKVLPKSITAFKSFPAASIEAVQKWLQLLSKDIWQRVTQDSIRNHRYPKSCTVHYHFSSKASPSERHSKSVRVAFPKKSSPNSNTTLALLATNAIMEREGSARIQLHRIGLAAMDFDMRPENGGIASYFVGRNETPDLHRSSLLQRATMRPVKVDDDNAPLLDSNGALTKRKLKYETEEAQLMVSRVDDPTFTPKEQVTDLDVAKRLQARYDRENDTTLESNSGIEKRSKVTFDGESTVVPKEQATDLDLAKRLQASYDRENAILTTLEGKRQQRTKKMRIDNFFTTTRPK